MEFDIHQVRKILPHRAPFLMVDQVLEFTPGQNLTAVKNVSVNEPHFIGHFPDQKVMPGVLIVESMTQAAFLCVHDPQGQDGKRCKYSLKTAEAKFLRPVMPGDRLHIEVRLVERSGGQATLEADAFVDGTLVSSARIGIMVEHLSN